VPILTSLSDTPTCDVPLAQRDSQLVFVGSLTHVAEINAAIDILARVRARVHGTSLIIVGGGASVAQLSQWMTRAEALGVASAVRFTGHLDRERTLAEISSARVLILPREAAEYSAAGFPTKLAEYLASGNPVVVTSTGCIADYLVDGSQALLVAPGDIQAFAERVVRLLENPQEAAEIGETGREFATREFDAARHGRRIAEFITAVRDRRMVG